MPDISLFGTLNTGLLGVYASKLAMNVVAHNIANANTPGFSRQRPELLTMPPIPITSLTQPAVPLQIGTGVYVRDIKRVRDAFLDIQYRQTNNKYNYWDTITSNLHFVEQLFAEPSEAGIRYLFDSFWSGIEEVITDPTNTAAKRGLVSRTEELVQHMQDLYTRLEQLRTDIDNEIAQRTQQINAMVKRLADINAKVRTAVSLKYTPNDLLDERDRILDELSDLADIYYYEDAAGQITLRLGNQIVLTGQNVVDLRALERPFGKGFKEIFAGNSIVSINDGKLKSLFDLRDEVLVRYMNRLDEFALSLSDEFNLIHQDGFNGDGSVTGLKFFNDIEAERIKDSVLYRLAGAKRVENGPINRISGMSDRIEISDITTKPFIEKGAIVFFNGTNKVFSANVNPYDNVEDFQNTLSTITDRWFDLKIGAHGDGGYRLYFESSENLRNTLALDFNGNMFNTMGFATKNIDVFTIDRRDFKVMPGQYKVSINGTEEVINITNSTTLEDLATQLNTHFGSHITAYVHEDKLLILPTKSNEFNIKNLKISDSGGLFTQSNLHIETYKALDTGKETLENILQRSEAFSIRIGATEIRIDPTKMTIRDLADKINEANTGIIAEVTPHSKFVLRGSRSLGFELKKVIQGPEALWTALGFIDPDGNPLNDWDEGFVFVNPFEKPEDQRIRYIKADALFIDKQLPKEPYRFVEKLKVNSTIQSNPETIAVDIGYTEENPNWDAKVFKPSGRANTKIVEMLSALRNKKLLNDGLESFNEYLGSVVAELGVESETAMKIKSNTDLMKKEIDGERERVKGVSLDEEMANMIKYQQAFNAAARVMTAVDDMISRVIDKLGLVGR
ncbi:flagellar hook-associated protein FlgK [Fervidobacterium nodosum]|uniref:Flagellar hook-associated protein 1 n=1 Tax=Fervidobacterium nodosum (strain ATCC 35602 / DSM 5306 / Rt17-B1) TaxID=381764 RepID=A7HNK3_FERNB|nr:flagellar hook-associated protein FlgK [Fervidobacterium nodosum]ABS61486.1 flagellar hook-associated protein FlgK [Fervidobacterium nodosum Rt17-B1]